MTDIGLSPAWQATSASLRGSAHGVEGVNQDAVRLAELDGVPPTWVAAVSDGHGGQRYVRSETGSQLAVTAAVSEVSALLSGGRRRDARLLPSAVPLIVEAWRTAVRAHLASTPFTTDEVARAGAGLETDPLVAYGATLLIAVVSDDGVLLAQIGDGDALVRTHGFAVRPVPGDSRLVANETTSLCMDTAVQDFRFAELPDSAEVDLVLLSSDGYGNSFAAQDWWHKLVGDLAWYVDVHGFDDFASRLPDWLAESALVGGDDVTAAVLSRRLPAHVPAAPVASVVETPARTLIELPVDDDPPPPVRPSRRDRPGRRGVVVALLVALTVALLVAAAVFGAARLLGGEQNPGEVVTPTDSTTGSGATGSSRSPGTSTPSGRGESTPPQSSPPTEPDSSAPGGLSSPPTSGSKDGGTTKP